MSSSVQPRPSFVATLGPMRPVGQVPPPSVRDEIAYASERAGELAEADRELHFELAPGGGVIVQVRDLAGNVIREITGAEALDIMSGLEDA
jgi:uncharacterized FlaG/YvyC family protein